MENNNSSHRPTEVKVGEPSGFVHRKIIRLIQYGGGSKGKVQGVRTAPPPPEITCGFLIQLLFTSDHQSVTPFFSGAPLLKKILDPPLQYS